MDEKETGLPLAGEPPRDEEEENFEHEHKTKHESEWEHDSGREHGAEREHAAKHGDEAECDIEHDATGDAGNEANATRAVDDEACDRGISSDDGGGEALRGDASPSSPPAGTSAAPTVASARRETPRTAGETDDRLNASVCDVRRQVYDELREFLDLFPEVGFSELPREVRESTLPLSAAYALYERRQQRLTSAAERENERNRSRSAGGLSGNLDAPYTRDEILAMTRDELRRNFDDVMRSIEHR